MSQEVAAQGIIPASSVTTDSSFPDLFDDVALVRNQLDCLGIQYNPNNIANLLLEYDSNSNRVSIVINRIIDEPTDDVQITFESNSPIKNSNPQNNCAAEKDEGILEVQVVKKVNTDATVVKVENKKEPARISIDLDDDDCVPSPSKLFKSVNPKKNPFMSNLRQTGDSIVSKELRHSLHAPSTSSISITESENRVIDMTQIDEFLNDGNNDEFLNNGNNDELELEIDSDASFNQNILNLNKRLKELNDITSNKASQILKSASKLAKEDLQTGSISCLNLVEEATNRHLSFVDEKVKDQDNLVFNQQSANIFEQKNSDIPDNKQRDNDIPQVKKITTDSQKTDSEFDLSSKNQEGDNIIRHGTESIAHLKSKKNQVSASRNEHKDNDLTRVKEITAQFIESCNSTIKTPSSSFTSSSLMHINGNLDNIENITAKFKNSLKSEQLDSKLSRSGETSNRQPGNTSSEVSNSISSVQNEIVQNSTSQRQQKRAGEAVALDNFEAFWDLVINEPSSSNAESTKSTIKIVDAINKTSPSILELKDTPSENSITQQPSKIASEVIKPEAILEEKTSTDRLVFPSLNSKNVNGEVTKPTKSVTFSKTFSPVASSSKVEIPRCQPSTSGIKIKISGLEKGTAKVERIEAPTSSKNEAEPMPKYLANLMEIFPDAETDYLRDLCKKAKELTNQEQALQQLIDSVMDNPNYPRRIVRQVETQPAVAQSFDEKYQNIMAILPNIDPEFVENKCKELTDDDMYTAFINELLTTKQYPTIRDYEKRKETEKAIKAYTDNFTIPSFLAVFPDPDDYFLNKKSSTHHDHSLAFLKERYKLLRADDITKAYSKNKSNLTQTCIKLDAHPGPFRKTRRSAHEWKYPEKKDINFLQEMSFINNRYDILNYIKNKKKEREDAFKRAKENNELLTCGCCFDEEILQEDIIACGEGHIFCQNCVKQMGEIKLGERKSKVECMSGGCESEFSLKDLQKVLVPNAFSKFVKIKQSEEIKAAGIEGLVACPFCDFASIPPPEDKIFKCLNPDCMKESCRLCNEESHIPLRCNEVEKNLELKARLLIEEKMTEALMRECYRCKTKFIKEDGCNKMTCSHCGALSCYICRKPVKDYSHFNGDNGDNTNRCPLYSENDLLHVEAVRVTAQGIKDKLLKENPNLDLKIDPTLVLPESSYKNKNVPGYRQQQRGLVLDRALPADVPRDNLPPVDLRPPQPIIPPHLLEPNVPQAYHVHQGPRVVHRRHPVAHLAARAANVDAAMANVNAAMANLNAIQQVRLNHVNHVRQVANAANLYRARPVNQNPPANQARVPVGRGAPPAQPDEDEDSDESYDSDASYDNSFIDDDGWDSDLSFDDPWVGENYWGTFLD